MTAFVGAGGFTASAESYNDAGIASAARLITNGGAIDLSLASTQITNAGGFTVDVLNGTQLSALSLNSTVATSIIGSARADSITGGNGNDNLSGGALIDTLIGGAGDDIITGGTESDSLTGGAGNDQFIYLAAHATGLTFGLGTATSGSRLTPQAGNTFTGAEVVTDLVTGDSLSLGNASAVADAGTVGTLQANEYLILQGTYVNGVFTVGANGTTGPDSIVLYDADAATAGIQETAIVLLGVINAEEAAIVNNVGVLTVFGA